VYKLPLPQLIPSVTGKQTDQWVNHYWIENMKRILVTPYGKLAHDLPQWKNICKIVNFNWDEVIIDNCAYSIFKGYLKVTPKQRLAAQIELAASTILPHKKTIVVPDFVQDFDRTMSTYLELEEHLLNLGDYYYLMYVLQGDPDQMRDGLAYIINLHNDPNFFPEIEIAVASQERTFEELKVVRIALKQIICDYKIRIHLFGETRKRILRLFQGIAKSYDTSNCFFENYRKKGYRGDTLYHNVAKTIAEELNSRYCKIESFDRYFNQLDKYNLDQNV